MLPTRVSFDRTATTGLPTTNTANAATADQKARLAYLQKIRQLQLAGYPNQGTVEQPQSTDFPVQSENAPIEQRTNADLNDTSTNKSSWIGKVLAPRQDELDTENNGTRWRNALENDFLMPGSEYANQVMKGAQIEKETEDAQNQSQNGLNARANEYHRRSMMDQYNKLLADYNAGRWNTGTQGKQAAYQAIENLRAQYAAEGYDPNELRQPSPQVGGNKELSSKTVTDLTTTISDTEYFANELEKNLKEGKPLDQNVLDKVSQNVLAQIGNDSKNMDAGEKTRIQTQMLSDADLQRVLTTMKWYRNTLYKIQASGASKRWEAGWQDKLAKIQQDGANGRPDLAFAGLIALLKSNEKQLPTDLASNYEAAQQQYKDYMNAMLLAAQVDQAKLYIAAKYLHDKSQYDYNTLMQDRGVDRRKTNALPDLDLNALRATNTQNSPFLNTPGFAGPEAPQVPKPIVDDADPNRNGRDNGIVDKKPGKPVVPKVKPKRKNLFGTFGE